MSLVDEVRFDCLNPLPSPAVARAIRIAAGTTQGQIATALGVSRVTVTLWESGRSQPRREHRRAYTQLLADLRRVVGA